MRHFIDIYSPFCTVKMEDLRICVAMGVVVILDFGLARYTNDVHSNTVEIDKSSGFHILELHGYTAGVTSSIFATGLLLICATYVAFKMGIGRIFKCCCNQGFGGVGYVGNRTEGLIMTPQTAQAVQMVAPTTTTAPMSIRNSV